VSFPSLELELELLQTYDRVIGIDEVGRGSIAGPVAVGAAAFTIETAQSIPTGLRDSKLITEPKRDSVAALTKEWVSYSVGMQSAAQSEQFGISKALQKAAAIAIEPLVAEKTVLLLDGSHNFLAGVVNLPVITRTKADRDCAIVSAAALCAKVERDELMRALHTEYPFYDWDSNKGYASESHIAALRSMGPSKEHRISWLTKILGAEELF
jgi:ribonuclease HII